MNNKLYSDRICDPDPEKKPSWGSVCRNVLDQLRKKKKTDYGDMYMDYLAFNSKQKCSDVQVWIPQWRTHGDQTVLFCYVRPLLIQADTMINTYRFKPIPIYPKSCDEIMVFKYNPIIETYTLVHIFLNLRWSRYIRIPIKLFQTPVPKVYSKINEIYDQLHKKVLALPENR